MSFPWSLIGGPVAKLANTIVDNLLETEEEKADARAKLMKLEQEGRLSELQVQMSAIVAEAKSRDKYTSRARPSFLYVIYFVILLCVFGGILGIWFPDQTTRAAANINALLNAIPEALWWLFGTGYLGYTGARSIDKWRLKGAGK